MESNIFYFTDIPEGQEQEIYDLCANFSYAYDNKNLSLLVFV